MRARLLSDPLAFSSSRTIFFFERRTERADEGAFAPRSSGGRAMKATILMLLGMGLASFGAGCAVDTNADDQEATQEEQSVSSTSEALCRRVCSRNCFINRFGRRECRTTCRSVCR